VKISGIGPAKEAALRSYGIESAADVDQRKVLAVPGFGSINSRPLLEWRQELEKKFVYDPQPNAVDQAVLGKIRGDTLQKAAHLRHELSMGAKELWKAVHACEQMRKTADPVLSRLDATRNQIKADFAFLGIPLPPSPPKPPRQPTPPPRAPARPSTSKRQKVVAPMTVPAAPLTMTVRFNTGIAGSPNCPRCSLPMVKRIARRGRRRGGKFWGCSQYPVCRGTRSI
jgi:Topoisomerase DNA binding C4 zinc finger